MGVINNRLWAPSPIWSPSLQPHLTLTRVSRPITLRAASQTYRGTRQLAMVRRKLIPKLQGGKSFQRFLAWVSPEQTHMPTSTPSIDPNQCYPGTIPVRPRAVLPWPPSHPKPTNQPATNASAPVNSPPELEKWLAHKLQAVMNFTNSNSAKVRAKVSTELVADTINHNTNCKGRPRGIRTKRSFKVPYPAWAAPIYPTTRATKTTT